MPNIERTSDGDNGFIGVDCKSNPASLKAGVLQDANNIRLELNTLQVRKGIETLISEEEFETTNDISGVHSYVKTDGSRYLVIISKDSLYLYNLNTAEIVGNYPFPEFREIADGSTVNMVQAANKIYILRGEAERYITGNGASGQKVVFSGTTATVTTSEPHGLVEGQEFVIETNSPTTSGPTVVNNLVVDTVVDNFTFTYEYALTYSGESPYVIQVCKPVLEFDGNSVKVVKQGIIDGTVAGGSTATECDFPPTSVAYYHKNRLFVKYSKDEIAVSDYLPNEDGNWVFDLTIQALTVNQGDEQEIVGFHPWTRDEVLVLKTGSIYAAKFADNTDDPNVALQNSYVRSLTLDLGCVSQRSIANVSGVVFFLSKKGVLKLEPQLDTALLANTAPMSIHIQKYIDRINQNYAYKSVATVFNGRYYLAVPLDDSEVNNHVLVYNLTNEMWESIDTFDSLFNINGMIQTKLSNTSIENKLLYWNNRNGVYIADENNDHDQYGYIVVGISFNVYDETVDDYGIFLNFTLEPIVYGSSEIHGFAKTRRFIFNTLQSKRFIAAFADVNFNESGVLRTSVNTYNPDTSNIVDTCSTSSQEDKTRKFPVRKVAVGLDIEFNSLQGRPQVTSFAVEAAQIGRNLKNQQ